MKIKLITYCDSLYNLIGDLTIPRMREYAKKHAIEFSLYNKRPAESSDVYWHKISIVKSILSESDWVIWCDVDILFVNLDYIWEQCLADNKQFDLLVSSDHKGLCMGFFIIRNSEWSRRLLDTLEFVGNIKNEKVGIYDNKNQREQDALKVLKDYFSKISDNVQVIPESIISNPRSKNQKLMKVFAHHFWANRGIDKVLNEIKEFGVKKWG